MGIQEAVRLVAAEPDSQYRLRAGAEPGVSMLPMPSLEETRSGRRFAWSVGRNPKGQTQGTGRRWNGILGDVKDE